MLPFRLYIFLLFCSISLFTQSASSKQAALHQPTTSLPLVFLHTSALAFENLVTTYLDTFRITQQHCRAAPYIQHERAYIYAHLIPFYTTIPPTSLELLRSAFRSINSNISAIAHSARPIHIAHLDALAALVDMLTEARDSFSLLFDAESRPGTGTSTTATASTTAGYTNWYSYSSSMKKKPTISSPTAIFFDLATRLPGNIERAMQGFPSAVIDYFDVVEGLLGEIGLRGVISPGPLFKNGMRGGDWEDDVDGKEKGGEDKEEDEEGGGEGKKVKVDFNIFPLSRVGQVSVEEAEALLTLTEVEKRDILQALREKIRWRRLDDGEVVMPTNPSPSLILFPFNLILALRRPLEILRDWIPVPISISVSQDASQTGNQGGKKEGKEIADVNGNRNGNRNGEGEEEKEKKVRAFTPTHPHVKSDLNKSFSRFTVIVTLGYQLEDKRRVVKGLWKRAGVLAGVLARGKGGIVEGCGGDGGRSEEVGAGDKGAFEIELLRKQFFILERLTREAVGLKEEMEGKGCWGGVEGALRGLLL